MYACRINVCLPLTYSIPPMLYQIALSLPVIVLIVIIIIKNEIDVFSDEKVMSLFLFSFFFQSFIQLMNTNFSISFPPSGKALKHFSWDRKVICLQVFSR